MNSAFIADGETQQIFDVKEIDPSQVATDNRFPKGFQLKVLKNIHKDRFFQRMSKMY